ncbi:MAG: cupredoxin domain-containing protein, partial [archaeon]
SEFSFKPQKVTIYAGTTVVWTNTDSQLHTATSDNGSFDVGTIEPETSKSYTFTSSGYYNYHCAAQPLIKGTIIVR